MLPDKENRLTFIGDLDKTPFRNVFFHSSGADKQMEDREPWDPWKPFYRGVGDIVGSCYKQSPLEETGSSKCSDFSLAEL